MLNPLRSRLKVVLLGDATVVFVPRFLTLHTAALGTHPNQNTYELRFSLNVISKEFKRSNHRDFQTQL